MIEPLQPQAMPTHGVVVELTPSNTWPVTTSGGIIRCGYIATNSSGKLSFVSLQSATWPAKILRIATRPALFADMADGFVVELHLSRDLIEDDRVCLSLAQSGATAYYAPQPIDDFMN